MKKLLLVLVAGLLGTATTQAQVLFSESFDQAGGFAAQGWTLYDVDGATTNANVSAQFGATSSWIVDSDFDDATDSVAMSTSWMDPVTATDDWMITPMITGLTVDAQLSWEEEAQDAAYPDGYTLYICTSIAGATPATSDFTGGTGTTLLTVPAASGAAWLTQNVSLAAYAGQNIWLAWRNNSTDQFVLMIDNVVVENVVAADDIAVDTLTAEYTSIPLSQVTAMPLEAQIANVNTNNITDAVLTVNVYDGGGLVTTASSTPAAVNSGTYITANAGSFTPTAVGLYQFEYIVSTALGSDIDANNDTLYYNFIVDAGMYARDDGVQTVGLGIGAGSTANLGNVFAINNAAVLDSVWWVSNGIAGDTIEVVIYDMVGGLPNAIIGGSGIYVWPADSLGTHILPVTDLASMPLNLGVGDYYVALSEYSATDNMGLGYTDNIYTPGVGMGNINGGAWGTIESFGFPNTAMVRPFVSPNCTPFTFASTATDAGCGLSDGTAMAMVSGGGVAPFTYMWDAAAANQTTQTATGLAAGIYTVMITDANGCMETDTITVANPNAPTATGTGTDATCGGTDGTATATASGGTPPYTYQWDAAAANQTTATATNLAAGTYTVTVLDASSCSASITVTINDIAGPTATSTIDANVTCNGDADGSATANPTGGTAPYTYAWDAAAASQTTATATGLAAGTYDCVITDANGCTVTVSVTITEPVALSATTVDNLDGSATATAAGGTAPYTYSWDDPSNQTTQTATGLTTGTYICTVTDANGCTTTSTVNVSVGFDDLVNNLNVVAYPNPVNENLTLVYNFEASEDMEVRLMNNVGQVIESLSVNNVIAGQVNLDVTNVADGLYMLVVTTATGKVVKPIVVSH